MPAYLSLVNPLWAWGVGAAVAVPVLAHLLSQRSGRLAVFPTIRFFQRAVDEGRRWLRLRHALLLALRVAALALAALAFARPLWHSKTLAAPGQGLDVALLVDRSASMTRSPRGGTLFDQARREALAVLRQLDPARDRATVILVDASPRALLPEPSANFSLLAQLLEDMPVTFERGDLEAALRLAVVMQERSGEGGAKSDERRAKSEGAEAGRARLLEVFSDMQATQRPAAGALAPAALRGAQLRWHAVGAEEANLAVYRPALTPSQPVAGQPATLSVEVADFAPAAHPARVVPVTLRCAGQTQTVPVALSAGAAATANFTLIPARPGPGYVEISLPERGDALPADDRTGLFFEALPARRVALVTAAKTDDPATSAFYLARALVPDAVSGSSGIALDLWAPDNLARHLTATDAAPPATVVIAEAGVLPAPALAALRAYLTEGGGVLWVIDGAPAAETLRRFTPADGKTLLSPVALAPGQAWGPSAHAALASGRFDDPILAVFEGPARAQLLEQRFAAALAGGGASGGGGGSGSGSQALLTRTDGVPLLAYRWIAAGRLAVLGADLAPSRSDLVKQPVFVPLVHQLVRSLAPGLPTPANPHPGGAASITLRGAWQRARLAVRGPDDHAVPPGAWSVTPRGPDTLVQLATLDRPGAYTITGPDGAVLGGTWVELDPAESDLRIGPLGVAGASSAAAIGGVAPSAAAVAGEYQAIELWPWLIALAVGLVGVELVFLTWSEGVARG